jgi:hypothetical protein
MDRIKVPRRRIVTSSLVKSYEGYITTERGLPLHREILESGLIQASLQLMKYDQWLTT